MVEVPRSWYNVVPDLPRPLPPPMDPYIEDSRIGLLPKLFPRALIDQEFTAESSVEIPEGVRRAYARMGRPTPLVRAEGLEELLGVSARIYYKREDLSPTGSHKVNTALAQAYYAKEEGVEVLTTETSAGQWGSALALACSHFKVGCRVYMTRSSYQQKPYRRLLMELYGAEVVPSPSDRTSFGKSLLASNPNHPGSLGIAISEAVEDALNSGGKVKYAVGSVTNFVVLHQTVIGLEAMEQLKQLGEEPDLVVGCVGGGSNFLGLALPMIGCKLRGDGYRHTEFVAVESTASPKMTRGLYRYEHVDSAGVLPMLKMYALSKDHVPPPIHAAGLRYHAASPILSLLIKEGIIKPTAYSQGEVLEAGRLFARAEGLVPAPETAHAVRYVIDRVTKYGGDGTVILFCFSGHGLLDLPSYSIKA